VDLKNKLDLNGLLKLNGEVKKIFFYRICGTGMGAAACLMRENGYHVEGADLNFYPPMSTYLEETKIPLHQLDSFDWDYLKSFDLIVVGNVVPRLGEDARKVESLGVPFCSFPALMGAFILNDRNVVGVAGTHGKTTTTYFLTQIFEKLGQNPGYFIGGVIEGRPSSKLGEGGYFFIESDEYDSAYFEKISKFRSYCLNHMILTSLEFDHADIFDSIDDIKDEFREVLKEIKGQVVSNVDYSAIEDLKLEFPNNRWVSYGEHSDYGPRLVEETAIGTTFELKYKKDWITFSTNVVGKHNILNIASCLLFALGEGVQVDQLQKSIEKLDFVKRRQEVRGEYKGAIVIDDFAHHPRSVQCTIDSIKTKFPDKRLLVLLEPNSATARSNIFQDEFLESLLEADQVFFAKPERSTSVKSADNLDFEELVRELNDHNIPAQAFDKLDTLRKEIDNNVNPQSVLLVLSNGTCLGLWKSEFVRELK
jgi:UDP-N-acetylmuramate: L-alanyl-gamma-D-glutamyl-meso-diaminopimelate ligase